MAGLVSRRESRMTLHRRYKGYANLPEKGKVEERLKPDFYFLLR